MAQDLFDLTGRRALITGSSQGIGLALARGLAGAGASLVLNGRDGAKLDAAARALRTEGARVETLPFDVTDHAAARDPPERRARKGGDRVQREPQGLPDRVLGFAGKPRGAVVVHRAL